ncbi:MAG TPA: PhoH family protein, partial [Acidobacteriota bacterium]|nr:PhoH family protein [Acidobacteriota bacterium]
PLKFPEAGSLSRSEVYLLSRNFKGEGFPSAPNGDERGSRQPRLAVAPKTPGQRAYYDAIRAHDIVFSIGPAGTGKTYLAVACAVEALKAGQVRRIILTRPAIEAGESLGFLPGDIGEKIGPYLRPLYDALYDMIEAERIEKYIETGIIEMAPLAFMRGRTLNDAFIILDEAQNTTPEQMKMFLTRIGEGSRAVVTGDITQVDLPTGKTSGLVDARDLVAGIEGIAIVQFAKEDVVRHALVQRIVQAYEARDDERRAAAEGPEAADAPALAATAAPDDPEAGGDGDGKGLA